MQAKLKAILKERHISQRNLAKETGITGHTMTNKMHGYSEFTFTEVYKICCVLGIENPLEVFIPREDVNFKNETK